MSFHGITRSTGQVSPQELKLLGVGPHDLTPFFTCPCVHLSAAVIWNARVMFTGETGAFVRATVGCSPSGRCRRGSGRTCSSPKPTPQRYPLFLRLTPP